MGMHQLHLVEHLPLHVLFAKRGQQQQQQVGVSQARCKRRLPATAALHSTCIHYKAHGPHTQGLARNGQVNIAQLRAAITKCRTLEAPVEDAERRGVFTHLLSAAGQGRWGTAGENAACCLPGQGWRNTATEQPAANGSTPCYNSTTLR